MADLPPHEDPTLPPQLREALRTMAKRGPVVELTAPRPPVAPAWTEDTTVTEYGLRLRDGTLLTFDSAAARDRRQAEFERAEWTVTPLTRQIRTQRTDWTEQ